MLDEATVVPYLAGRGLVDGDARAETLAGGVSNIVLAVSDGAQQLVVKQSLPRLNVADEWTAPTSRVITEVNALDLAGRITPGLVPAVIDRDPQAHTVVIERAPAGWADWKSHLMAGRVDVRIAATLGRTLAEWHSATAQDLSGLEDAFGDAEPFIQLRVDPYHRTLARRAPEVATQVLHVADRMLARRLCLVHGDYSPKNVLVSSGEDKRVRVWVIDFEVAHLGDPAFDLGFMLTHLTMKSIHRPDHAASYDHAATEFVAAYTTRVTFDLQPDWQYVLEQVAALLLARVHGKSPAEYLTETQREQVWRLGVDVINDPPDTVLGLSQRRDLMLT